MVDEPRTSLPSADDAETFRRLVAAIEDYAIFMLAPDGRVATWNRGAERIKGYRAEEIVGRHFSAFYTPDDVSSGKCEFELAVAAHEGRFEDEAWRVRKDGTRFWANVVITAVHDHEGRLVGFAKITRDLTERKKAEEARLRLAQAQEALRLRDEFLLIAAHELRTPLTALLLQLQGLERAARDEDRPNAERLGRAVGSSRRLAALVDLLFDVSRFATGHVTLDRRPVDLAEITRQLVVELHDSARQAGCALELVVEGPVLGVWDRLRLEGAITNLITNALRYGGGGPVEIAVETRNGAAELSVTDQGPGVSEADLPRIFDRFERAAPADHHGGLGLGLYLVREVAVAHGGSIRAERRRARGARFVLRLPIGEAAASAPESDEASVA